MLFSNILASEDMSLGLIANFSYPCLTKASCESAISLIVYSIIIYIFAFVNNIKEVE